MRTFKVERMRDLAILPRTFDPPEGDVVARLRSAWDIIADQPATEVVLRFEPSVAGRVLEATWHPTQRVTTLPDGSLEWRATVVGHDRDPPVDPGLGQRRGGAGAAGAPGRRGRHAPPGRRPLRVRRTGHPDRASAEVDLRRRRPVGWGRPRGGGHRGAHEDPGCEAERHRRASARPWPPDPGDPRGIGRGARRHPPRLHAPRRGRHVDVGRARHGPWLAERRPCRHGLVAYRPWAAVDDLAAERAGRVAAAGVLSHDVAGGNVGDALDARGIPWSWYGEALGMSPATWGEDGRAADLRPVDGQRAPPRHPHERRRQLRRDRGGAGHGRVDLDLGHRDAVAGSHAAGRGERVAPALGHHPHVHVARCGPARSRPTPPACARSTSRSGATTAPGGRSATTRPRRRWCCATAATATGSRSGSRPRTGGVRSRRGPARSGSGCPSGVPRRRDPRRSAAVAAPVRRGQPHQRPDPRLPRAHQAPLARRVPRRGPAPTRTSPRTTCSTPRGSSGCGGSASSRARAGCSRRPSTRGSRTASG